MIHKVLPFTVYKLRPDGFKPVFQKGFDKYLPFQAIIRHLGYVENVNMNQAIKKYTYVCFPLLDSSPSSPSSCLQDGGCRRPEVREEEVDSLL